jgi:hypothetical protein
MEMMNKLNVVQTRDRFPQAIVEKKNQVLGKIRLCII